MDVAVSFDRSLKGAPIEGTKMPDSFVGFLKNVKPIVGIVRGMGKGEANVCGSPFNRSEVAFRPARAV